MFLLACPADVSVDTPEGLHELVIDLGLRILDHLHKIGELSPNLHNQLIFLFVYLFHQLPPVFRPFY